LVFWNLLYRTAVEQPLTASAQAPPIARAAPGLVAGSAPQAAVLPARGLGTVGWWKLLGYRQTWGIALGRLLLDPYWFLITEWFAIYLVSKGFTVQQSALGFWAPFLAADIGNFFGGGLSSYWIKRGWPVGKSRRTVLMLFGPSMLLLVPAAFSSSYPVLISLFAWSTFAYAACSTMFQSLPADVFDSRVVASVSGLGGTGAGIGTLISTYLIGHIADRFSFQPIIMVASLMPCIATVVFVTMVRANKKPDPNQILLDF
jgi:ACS family hexuronate transporter-like MFS transporter